MPANRAWRSTSPSTTTTSFCPTCGGPRPSTRWRTTCCAAGPPDVAVEIRSPSTWRYDIGIKRTRWAAAGLAELWLVDTEADTITLLRRSSPSSSSFDVSLEIGRGDTLTSPLIPGFSLDITTLFDR